MYLEEMTQWRGPGHFIDDNPEKQQTPSRVIGQGDFFVNIII